MLTIMWSHMYVVQYIHIDMELQVTYNVITDHFCNHVILRFKVYIIVIPD